MSDKYRLVRPFDIDDGELDGLSKQQCFVLGYELCQIDRLIKAKRPFTKTVHAANMRRIEAELIRKQRDYRFEWPHDDKSESWVYLMVNGAAR